MTSEPHRIKIYAAPLQGYTEAPWRRAHAMTFGGVDAYFTPFLRVEAGAVRRRDLRDAFPEAGDVPEVVPQAIFADAGELRVIADAVTKGGGRRLDLNMGCPFPPQCRRGRGVGILVRPERLREVACYVEERSDMTFSVKMRLGLEDAGEWREALDVLNAMPLHHITVHPRIARQQYTGGLYLDEFGELLERSRHPVVYNGDLTSAEEIDGIISRFPGLCGVMAGRGLLARPSLAAEWRSGEAADDVTLKRGVARMHDEVSGYYRSVLCGDSQVLSKLKPFWDYFEAVIGRKAWKKIRKATTLALYDSAVAEAMREYTD